MTSLYVILAFIVIFFVLFGVYLIGVDDGKKMKGDTPSIEIVIEMINEDECNGRHGRRHALTHADMVQMEAEARNNEKEKDKNGHNQMR